MLTFILKHLTFPLEMIPLQILIVLPVGGAKGGGYKELSSCINNVLFLKKGGTLMFIVPVFIWFCVYLILHN